MDKLEQILDIVKENQKKIEVLLEEHSKLSEEYNDSLNRINDIYTILDFYNNQRFTIDTITFFSGLVAPFIKKNNINCKIDDIVDFLSFIKEKGLIVNNEVPEEFSSYIYKENNIYFLKLKGQITILEYLLEESKKGE